MPIPTTHIQTNLSMAYVQAIAASAGVKYTPCNEPEYGVDCYLQRTTNLANGQYTQTGVPLSCQVKATTIWIEEPDNIVYDLDSQAYNKIVCFDGPIILVLFRMPQEQQDWLQCTESMLALRNCCYWITLPKGPETTNTSSFRIRISRKNLFDMQAVVNLLEMIRQNPGFLE